MFAEDSYVFAEEKMYRATAVDFSSRKTILVEVIQDGSNSTSKSALSHDFMTVAQTADSCTV